MSGLLKEPVGGWCKGRLRLTLGQSPCSVLGKPRGKNGVPSRAPGREAAGLGRRGMAQMWPAGGGGSGGPELSLTPGVPLVEHNEDVILNQLDTKGWA